ncbi:hypothetical protein DFH07DRAFT_769055 [Mycena maculata]|uniref:Uncharacterized protein n=1 Tax=Mycena maculata TaxID=230809 RepID=A0AAD7JRV6_9AGAR|nr:hypothetical protein DFH07DRAFT_769055 [Mycena maculata]
MSASTPLEFSLAPETAFSLLDEISKLRSLLGSSSGLGSSPELPGLLNLEQELRLRYLPVLPHPGPQQSPSESDAPLGLLSNSEEEDSLREPQYRRIFSAPSAPQRVNSRSPSPTSLDHLLLPSFLPPSLSHLTSTSPAPSSVLGKCITVTHPEPSPGDESPAKKAFTGIKWKIPVLRPSDAVGWDIAQGSLHDLDSDSEYLSSGPEGEDEYSSTPSEEVQLPSTPTKRDKTKRAKGTRPDRRNATSIRVGSDADIGYIGRRAAVGTVNTLQTYNGYRHDGTGPDVTLAAGVLLTQLLAIFTNGYAGNLQSLIVHLQNPTQGLEPLSGRTDMKSLVKDLISLETNAQVNDLLYMCKLIQLVLNVDQLRRDWREDGGARTLGVAAVAEEHGFKVRTFQHWHTWGSRLLHLCCAGLRTTLTENYHDAVKDINSLADAIREVSEGKWRPLVLRLIAGIHYLQGTPIPLLEDYQFVRGSNTFTFNDVKKGDEVLHLFKLPARAPDWNTHTSRPWAPLPSSAVTRKPADVVVIKTALKLERTSALPFKKGQEKAWTEKERGYADEAVIIDLHKSGKCPPEDSTGLRVVTLMTMPEDMTERLDQGFDGIDAVLPNEFSWEDSRREKYSYTSIAYTWYYRMGEKGKGPPTEVHPNKLHRGVKVNHHQRIPYSTVDTVQKAMEFETISQIFSEAFDFQRVNLQHTNPEALHDQFRVVTDAHKDGLDSEWCLIIFVKRGEGGLLVLRELGLKINGKTGNMLHFTSRWVTHFNTHFKGKRCSLVLHTDREGGPWVETSGGWAGHVARHITTYVRNE